MNVKTIHLVIFATLIHFYLGNIILSMIIIYLIAIMKYFYLKLIIVPKQTHVALSIRAIGFLNGRLIYATVVTES